MKRRLPVKPAVVRQNKMFIKKPYKTTDEFYEAIKKLIVQFQEHGFEEESKELETILHGVWTTGSELIGELMLFLEKTNVAVPKDTIKLKNNCLYFARHHRKILGLDK